MLFFYMAQLILSIGTNLGNKRQNLLDAIQLIESEVGSCIRISPFYKSEPWGFDSDNSFLNGIVVVTTDLKPMEVLAITQGIERQLGRKAKSINGYADRLIDIDIVDYDRQNVESERLTLPHRLMNERNFVLKPLCDVLPDWEHPLLKKTALELLAESPDESILETEL